MIDSIEIRIKPYVLFHDEYVLYLTNLTELGRVLPGLGDYTLDNVKIHCGHILIFHTTLKLYLMSRFLTLLYWLVTTTLT